MSLISCPNCESLMNAGETCPECDHTEHGECICKSCMDKCDREIMELNEEAYLENPETEP